jgi:hypothetical protein
MSQTYSRTDNDCTLDAVRVSQPGGDSHLNQFGTRIPDPDRQNKAFLVVQDNETGTELKTKFIISEPERPTHKIKIPLRIPTNKSVLVHPCLISDFNIMNDGQPAFSELHDL